MNDKQTILSSMAYIALADSDPLQNAKEAYQQMSSYIGANHERACITQVLLPMCKAHVAMAKKLQAGKETIFDLQMSDTLLEFISQVQDAGLHAEWIEFTDKLNTATRDKS